MVQVEYGSCTSASQGSHDRFIIVKMCPQCVHVSTEVLEKLTRCNPYDMHCTSVETNVSGRCGGGCINNSPEHMLKFVNHC